MLQVARFGLSTVIRGNCASKRLSRLSVIRPVAGSACSLRSVRDQARLTKRSVSLVLHNREPRGVQYGGFCQRVKPFSASDQLLQLPGLALRSVGAANTATSSEPGTCGLLLAHLCVSKHTLKPADAQSARHSLDGGP